MQRKKSRLHITLIKAEYFHNKKFLRLNACVPISVYILSICCLICFILFCGCSAFGPPTDYYEKTIEMEEHGEQTRYDTGEKPKENQKSSEARNSTKIVRKSAEEPPMIEVLPKPPQEEGNLATVKEDEIEKSTQEKTTEGNSIPLPNLYPANQKPELSSEPIAVSSDVIKTALEIAGINVRDVELVNRRVGGGKNSVRVNFICESSNVVNEKFFTICAVIYHLNKSSKTIDIVVGIAEDSQSDLLGVLQSDTEDIIAWMDNKITRAEWFSRITRKML